MITLAFSLADQIMSLPERGLVEALRSISPVIRRYSPAIQLSLEDQQDLALSTVEHASGDFATPGEVAAGFAEIRAALGL